jgi:hypothetical protein
MMKRLIHCGMAICACCTGIPLGGASMDISLADAVESAHGALWARMIKADGIMLDYADRDGSVVIPTPEECAQSKPNAMGWGTPIANGTFFTGLYLSAVVERHSRTKSELDKARARLLAQGLMRLAGLSDVPGYIARGIATDGKSHYPAGSDDQTHPWFFGLYRYAMSDLPDAAEKAAIVAKMTAVATALRQNRWRCPCAGSFTGQDRGAFGGKDFRDATRLLFILRAMHEVTRDASWLAAYHEAVREIPAGSSIDRSAICAEGCVRDLEAIKDLRTQMWIFAGAQASLAELARLETDPAIRDAYRQGLQKTARYAAEGIAAYRDFDNGDEPPFRLLDWRNLLNPNWMPQKTQDEATETALRQLREAHRIDWTSQRMPRRDRENRQMREPLAAAYIVAVSGDADLIATLRPQIESAIRHYEYGKLYGSLFFFAECTYYALGKP